MNSHQNENALNNLYLSFIFPLFAPLLCYTNLHLLTKNKESGLPSLGRFPDSNAYDRYSWSSIFNDGTGAMISFSKSYNRGGNAATLSSDYIDSPTSTRLDSTKFCTLTLTLKGNSLTRTVTDGTVTKTVTYTDDGSTFGAVLPAGAFCSTHILQETSMIGSSRMPLTPIFQRP